MEDGGQTGRTFAGEKSRGGNRRCRRGAGKGIVEHHASIRRRRRREAAFRPGNRSSRLCPKGTAMARASNHSRGSRADLCVSSCGLSKGGRMRLGGRRRSFDLAAFFDGGALAISRRGSSMCLKSRPANRPPGRRTLSTLLIYLFYIIDILCNISDQRSSFLDIGRAT